MARPLISKTLVRVAEVENAQYISHGATGKGNDQVRFELSIAALNPKLKIIAPWRDDAFIKRFAGRADLFKYAAANGIPLPIDELELNV